LIRAGGVVAALTAKSPVTEEVRMKKVSLLGIALAAVVCFVVRAADSDAGLKKGDSVAAFNVKDITGPSAGKSLCYRCQYGKRPVVSVFTRDVNDNVAKLVSEVDKIVEQNKDKKMAAFVVVLAEDADKIAPKLEAIAKKNNIKNVPLTIFDGESGPPEYKISKTASTTVMSWSNGEVKSNVALGKGELNDAKIKTVVAEASKVVE
jgi:hypothetical protein